MSKISYCIIRSFYNIKIVSWQKMSIADNVSGYLMEKMEKEQKEIGKINEQKENKKRELEIIKKRININSGT